MLTLSPNLPFFYFCRSAFFDLCIWKISHFSLCTSCSHVDMTSKSIVILVCLHLGVGQLCWKYGLASVRHPLSSGHVKTLTLAITPINRNPCYWISKIFNYFYFFYLVFWFFVLLVFVLLFLSTTHPSSSARNHFIIPVRENTTKIFFASF